MSRGVTQLDLDKVIPKIVLRIKQRTEVERTVRRYHNNPSTRGLFMAVEIEMVYLGYSFPTIVETE